MLPQAALQFRAQRHDGAVTRPRPRDTAHEAATAARAAVGRGGGFNVYPAEIEGTLNDIAGVVESAVIGVPHPDFGEAVVAVVVARPGAVPDPAALIGELKSKIANFKVPKRVFVVTELPRNAMGKVQKNLLREQHKGLFVA